MIGETCVGHNIDCAGKRKKYQKIKILIIYLRVTQEAGWIKAKSISRRQIQNIETG